MSNALVKLHKKFAALFVMSLMTLSISACATPVSPDVTPAACTAYWENSQGFLAGEVDNTPRAVKERLIVLHEAMVAACGEYQE